MPIQKTVFIKNYLRALNNGDAAIFAVLDSPRQVDVLTGNNY